MKTRLMRLTALTMGGLAALAGDLPRLDDSGGFAVGFSWISAAHADDAGGSQGSENVESGSTVAGGGGGEGASNRVDGGGSGGTEGSGDGSGSGESSEGFGSGAGGGGGVSGGGDDGGGERVSGGEDRSSSRDSRDYGPTGSSWQGGSNFLNLFRWAPESPAEENRPEPAAAQKSNKELRENVARNRREP